MRSSVLGEPGRITGFVIITPGDASFDHVEAHSKSPKMEQTRGKTEFRDELSDFSYRMEAVEPAL